MLIIRSISLTMVVLAGLCFAGIVNAAEPPSGQKLESTDPADNVSAGPQLPVPR